MKGTWLGGRTEAFCFSFIYPSAGREKRIRNIPGRKNSTDEKKYSAKEKKQEHGKAECRRGYKNAAVRIGNITFTKIRSSFSPDGKFERNANVW